MTTSHTTTTPAHAVTEPPRKRARSAYRRQVAAPTRSETGAPAVGPETRRRAAVILEVLAGVRTPASAAEALQIGPPRYYLLEQRAIQGLVAACEPRPQGRTPTVARQITRLERELVVCRRELARQQALARAAQRALGLSAPSPASSKAAPPATGGKKSRRRRKPAVRALRAARVLRGDSSGTETVRAVQPPAEERPSGGGNRTGEMPSLSPVMSGTPGGLMP
jgi:hypothetical protein